MMMMLRLKMKTQKMTKVLQLRECGNTGLAHTPTSCAHTYAQTQPMAAWLPSYPPVRAGDSDGLVSDSAQAPCDVTTQQAEYHRQAQQTSLENPSEIIGKNEM